MDWMLNCKMITLSTELSTKMAMR